MFYRSLLHESSQQTNHLESLAQTHVIAKYRSYDDVGIPTMVMNIMTSYWYIIQLLHITCLALEGPMQPLHALQLVFH